MAKLNVLLRKEDLDPSMLHDKVAVVIDTLFATSTIVAALHHGASDVYPLASWQMAHDVVRNLDIDSYLLAGESHMQRISGFAGFSPLALTREPLSGKRLVYSTTNGTVALSKAACARHVYAAALLNGPAVARQLLQHSGTSIVVICSGSAGLVNLEDLFTAGYLVDRLCNESNGAWELTDTCRIALAVYWQYADQPESCLRNSRLGQVLAKADLDDELHYAAQLGLLEVIPTLDGNRLIALNT